MKYLFLPLFLFALLSLQAEESPERKKRTCRIFYQSRPPEALREAYLFDGRSSQRVVLSGMNFSEVIELPDGEMTLSISQEVPSESVPLPEGAPSVSIGEAVSDFFLLVERDSSNEIMPIKLKAIDISEDKLNDGEILWINQTEHKISVELGDQALVILPKDRSTSPPPLEDSGYYKAEFTYQREGKGDFLPIMRKSWWFDATSRNLGFIVETGARLPKIFTIRDHR